MAEIRPIRGLRYNTTVVDNLASVIAPPYDIIPPEQQQALYDRSPYNVIRLELGQALPGDDETTNRYTRARDFLTIWKTAGVLRPDTPSLYIHEHRFPHNGTMASRTELMAGLRLHDWAEGIVLPHENTLPKPKADRLQLMRACRCNLSPIMLLYEDEDLRAALTRKASERLPDEVALEGGQEHRLWVVDDQEFCRWVADRLAPQKLYIADGHHRYETALAYRQEAAETGLLDRDHPANFVLASLFDFRDPGLVVLPTHRMVKGIEPDRLSRLPDALASRFKIASWPIGDRDPAAQLQDVLATMAKSSADEHSFGLYGPELDRMFVISVPRSVVLREGWTEGGSEAYRQLDVTVLHQTILSQMLGIDGSKITGETHVAYTRDPLEAIQSVANGTHQLAFLLNSTRAEEVRDVALAGDRMPQKSTYFYPKAPSGLIINPLG